tara:strand:- start:4962 stop:6026 length:1065 start_codon:yes stop_codon:yes gene_type:complete
MRDKKLLSNIDNSQPSKYPNGRIKDSSATGNGTPVNEKTKGDIHEFFDKLLRLAGIKHNNLPDNEENGYQTIEALRNFATRNNYLQDVNPTGSAGEEIISTSVDIFNVKNKEIFICKAEADYNNADEIKRSFTSGTKPLLVVGGFRTGDYLRMICETNQVTLIRIGDDQSAEQFLIDNGLLAAATQTEENTGESEEVVTTPKTNKVAFAKRVNGVDSANYLSSASQNGLMSKADYEKLASLGNPKLRNVGNFSGLDVGGNSIGTNLTSVGDIVSAVVEEADGGYSLVRVTLQNSMATNYYVNMSIESLSGSNRNDLQLKAPMFRRIDATSFHFQIDEASSNLQNLRIHIEAINI